MSKILLRNVTFLYKVPDDRLSLDEEQLERISEFLDSDRVEDGNVFNWISSSFGIYNSESDNVGQCVNCGAWMTDSEGNDPVKELSRGAKIDGNLLCDICLPKEHPIAF